MNSVERRPYLSAYLALGAGLVSIGFSAIFVRQADAPGTVSAFYRMAIAALLVAPVFLKQLTSRPDRLPRLGVALATLGGLLFALDLTFWASGIVLSGATNPTLTANTAPIWVGFGSLLFYRERLGAGFWIGLAVAMAGAAMVLGTDLGRAIEFGLGTFLGLLAAVFYGAYYLVTQRGRVHLDTLSYFWIAALSSSLALLAINVGMGQSLVGFGQGTYLNFLALGVVVQTMGWMVINYAQGYLPARIVAPTLLGQPVVTAIAAVFILREEFAAGHVVGGGTVLLGVYLVHRSRAPRP